MRNPMTYQIMRQKSKAAKKAAKKWYESLTPEGLERLSLSNKEKIEHLEAEIQELDRAIAQIKPFAERISQIRKNIEETWRPHEGVGNALSEIFFNPLPRQEAKAYVSRLRQGLEEIFAEIKQKNISINELSLLERRKAANVEEITRLEGYIKKNESRIKSIVRKAESEEKKRRMEAEKEERIRKKRELEKAKLAQFAGKSRDLSQSIKKNLSKPELCPYCGGDIGDDPHADHIWPVKLGGLSAPWNMVHVCSDCNLKKADLTLRQFCRRYAYDFKEIEKRLEDLGKKF